MERLWAPWRMAYISGAGDEAASDAPANSPPHEALPATGCVFCDKVAEGPEADRANLILWRGTHVFCLLNLYPYNSAHLMVVPYRHLADVTLLTAPEQAALMAGYLRMVGVLNRVYRPDGYNMGMNLGHTAGAAIADHVHLHLVPRWTGDTNFMPVVGETKVLPESLDATWARLRAGLAAEEGEATEKQ